MRALVQEPMKTRSMAISSIGVPAVSAMYSSARAADSRSAPSAKSSGLGTASVTGTDCAGLVPQVTYGTRSAASMMMMAS